MRTPSKIITALALAGLAVAGGAAFTAPGLNNTGTTEQWIGGTVSQTITGASLTNVEYVFVGGATGPRTNILSIVLTISNADTKSVSVKTGSDSAANQSFGGTAGVGTAGTAEGTDAWAGVGTVASGTVTMHAVGAKALADLGVANVNSLAITVS